MRSYHEHARELKSRVEALRENGDRALRALDERRARQFDEDEPPPDKRPNGGAKPQRFPLVKFDDVLLTTTSFYRVKGLLPAYGLVVVWGPPKCGKSFWVFDLLMHVALGWEYRGLRVRPGPVVYCALEGKKGFPRRLEAFRRKYPKSNGAPFYLMSVSVDLIRDHKALIASIRAQMPDGGRYRHRHLEPQPIRVGKL